MAENYYYHKRNYFCKNYDCANCPMRNGELCEYNELYGDLE